MPDINNDRGSMTIEASLIVSVIIFIISGLIFSFILLHQKTMLEKAALMAAQQGAEIWADIDRDIESRLLAHEEKISFRELYQQLFDFSREYEEDLDLNDDIPVGSGSTKGSLQDRKFYIVRNMVYDQLHKGLLKPQSTKLTIGFTNNYMVRKIEITVVQDVKIPLSGIYQFFGGESTLKLKGTGAAVVSEPDEYIRNIDLGLEYANKAVEAISIQNRLKQLIDKIGG